ncbi:hypothetical protein HN51_068772 [Arachis hypogaea]|uniref:VTT domain-containing protein n=1 Tax=Arachis hypogaea TaxID=3818 RepID=A0A444Z914_ARAHY|nr:uncharacterized protein LOC107642998 [Arachis ipaensis]XP_025653649.1 uncharacterized protein LOC112749571 [Arachis hypogaea]QHO10896.1 TVP38/TMEM64 family membrane protein [Arachis hypogaea]RYR10656.1 hypothetical protein Ahy_B05g079129 [Arachis hypogaea]
MTYREDEDDATYVKEVDPSPTFRIHVDDDNGDYVKLSSSPQEEEENPSPPSRLAGVPVWYLVKLSVTCTCLAIAGFFLFKWLGPPFIEKVIIPLISWEEETFSPPVLAALMFASVALFPVFFLPSSPTMWMTGMSFGYVVGYMIIVSGVAIGVSLPFFIGSFFHRRIEEWLEKYPKRAAVLKAAGGGNWFHQFKAVALIRISPFPYILYNYCAVATEVQYWPYLLGSLVGMQFDIITSIYTGILIRAFASVHKENTLSSAAPHVSVTLVGFGMIVGTVIFFTVYAKRQLRELQKEDQRLLG